MRPTPILPAIVVAAHGLPAAAADAFHLTLNPSTSLTTTTSVFAPSAGTLIGNYDPVTNPGGTRTIPGLFGGSGNNAIPLEVDLSIDGGETTTPTGTATILTNTGAGVFAFAALDLDLLGGTSISLPISGSLLFSSFHTVNPTFIYPGGTPYNLPLGEATLTSLTVTLGPGSAEGTLTPNGDGSYALSGSISLDITPEALVLGQPFPSNTIPFLAPVSGTLTPAPDGNSATLTLLLDVSAATIIPGPIAGPENTPFDLPTLDSSNPAHVLVTLVFDQIDVAIAGIVNGSASGPRHCKADFNLDGSGDILDFLDFFDAFGVCDGSPAPCQSIALDADVNSDGLVDILDFLDFLDAFGAGCN